MFCQFHADRPAISPAADPFLCEYCATVCQWCNEVSDDVTNPDTCVRDHAPKPEAGFTLTDPARHYCSKARRAHDRASIPSAAEAFEAKWTPRMAGWY